MPTVWDPWPGKTNAKWLMSSDGCTWGTRGLCRRERLPSVKRVRVCTDLVLPLRSGDEHPSPPIDRPIAPHAAAPRDRPDLRGRPVGPRSRGGKPDPERPPDLGARCDGPRAVARARDCV